MSTPSASLVIASRISSSRISASSGESDILCRVRETTASNPLRMLETCSDQTRDTSSTGSNSLRSFAFFNSWVSACSLRSRAVSFSASSAVSLSLPRLPAWATYACTLAGPSNSPCPLRTSKPSSANWLTRRVVSPSRRASSAVFNFIIGRKSKTKKVAEREESGRPTR